MSVVAVDDQSAGSPQRMREDAAGNGVVDESKRSMGLLRLGRSRWDRAEASKRSMGLASGQWVQQAVNESSKRSMGLLRLGRSDAGSANVDDDEKRSMQLLRLGRKRNDDEDLLAAAPDDQMPRRCAS